MFGSGYEYNSLVQRAGAVGVQWIQDAHWAEMRERFTVYI